VFRPQTWEEMRTNEQMITCNSCGRIFYYDPTHEATPPPEPPKQKTKARAAEAEPEPQPASAPAAKITPTQ